MPDTRQHPSSAGLFKQAFEEGVELAQAEVILAKSELVATAKSYIVGVGICIAALSFLTATLVLAGIFFATLFSARSIADSFAYGMVSLAMLVFTILAFAAGYYQLTRRSEPQGTILSWLGKKHD